MSRTRTILLIILGIALVMVTIHFAVNGLPALNSLNPHAR